MEKENIKEIKEIGKNLISIADDLTNTEEKAEMNDLYLDLEQNFNALRDIMIKEVL